MVDAHLHLDKLVGSEKYLLWVLLREGSGNVSRDLKIRMFPCFFGKALDYDKWDMDRVGVCGGDASGLVSRLREKGWGDDEIFLSMSDSARLFLDGRHAESEIGAYVLDDDGCVGLYDAVVDGLGVYFKV